MKTGDRAFGTLSMVPLGYGEIVGEVNDGTVRKERMFRFRPDNGDGGSYPLYESELQHAS
jgi:hypothetical protein